MKNKIIKHYGATLLCCLCVAVVTGNLTDINNRIAKLREDLYKQFENYKPDLYNDTISLNEHKRNFTELTDSIVNLREDLYKQFENEKPYLNISYNDLISFLEHEHPHKNSFPVRRVLLGILVVIKVILLMIRLCVYMGNKNDDLNDTAGHHDNVVYCTYPFLFVMILTSVAITIILIL